MEFIEIVTGLGVMLVVPLLVLAVVDVVRFAATRRPPSRSELNRRDKHAEAT